MHLARCSSDHWSVGARAAGNGSNWKGIIARRCEQKVGDDLKEPRPPSSDDPEGSDNV